MNDYLTVREVAELLKLNQQTIRNWIDRGELPASRTGRRVRIARADLQAKIDTGRTQPPEPDVRSELAGALRSAADAAGSGSDVQLVDALERLIAVAGELVRELR